MFNPFVLQKSGQLKDITDDAYWTVSSQKGQDKQFKYAFDGSSDTFWQSDGSQPHFLTAFYNSRIQICAIAIYLDFNQDESYTPKLYSYLLIISNYSLIF